MLKKNTDLNKPILIEISFSVIINSLFPALIASPILAVSCDSVTVDSYVHQLKNLEQEKFDALAKCGALAVPALIGSLEDNDQEVRRLSAYALGLIGPESQLAIQPLIRALLDKNNNSTVRTEAAYSLGDLKSQDQTVISALLKALKDDSSANVRAGAVYALGINRAIRQEVVLQLINVLDSSDENEVRRFAARALGQIAEQDRSSVQPYAPQTLIKVIQSPNQDSSVLVECAYALGAIQETSDKAIKVLIATFNSQPSELRIRSALALAKIAEFVNSQANTQQDIETALPVVAEIQTALGKPELLNSDPSIRQSQEDVAIALQNLQAKQKVLLNEQIMAWLAGGRRLWLAHAVFWLLLVFVYPKSRPIQAIFFWNPWIRNILGMGYVTFLLQWTPYLRRKLFAPFRYSLLADAGLDSFNPDLYFSDSRVSLKGSDSIQSLTVAFSRIQGQVILEGESGLGKTMFVRHLLKDSKRIVVYLPATKCTEGVIEAIQKKLHGDEIKDPKFLQSLVVRKSPKSTDAR